MEEVSVRKFDHRKQIFAKMQESGGKPINRVMDTEFKLEDEEKHSTDNFLQEMNSQMTMITQDNSTIDQHSRNGTSQYSRNGSYMPRAYSR
jgi:hypothetical protein